jgi:hypothetical protein
MKGYAKLTHCGRSTNSVIDCGVSILPATIVSCGTLQFHDNKENHYIISAMENYRCAILSL